MPILWKPLESMFNVIHVIALVFTPKQFWIKPGLNIIVNELFYNRILFGAFYPKFLRIFSQEMNNYSSNWYSALINKVICLITRTCKTIRNVVNFYQATPNYLDIVYPRAGAQFTLQITLKKKRSMNFSMPTGK